MNILQIKKLLANDIKELNKYLSDNLNSNIPFINEISNYIIESGGKRIRPTLFMLITNALNYKHHNKYKMATVIELIHTATLLHDDVVDNSNYRRGNLTINKKWNNASAVLVGDFLYSRAFEIMVAIDNMQIMQIMAKTTNNIAEGEVMQLINCGNIDINEEEYLATISAKTACLFSAATKTAGILAGNNNLENLVDFGNNIGKAFQIIDDIIDYKSNIKVMGKNTGDDFIEGKLTLPIIYALNNSNTADKDILVTAINTHSNIKQVIKIMSKVGAFDYAMDKAKQYATKAKQNIAYLTNSNYKDALLALCDLSLLRKS